MRGLKAFRRGFPGRIWLEVMLVRGLSDRPAHLRRLKALIDALGPDRVQLNTVVRPPADASAKPLSRAELERARRILGPASEIIADFDRLERKADRALRDEDVLSVLRRRPVTLRDLAASLGRPVGEVCALLASLIGSGRAARVAHEGRAYYEAR